MPINFTSSHIRIKYGIRVKEGSDPFLVNRLAQSLGRLDPDLVDSCGIRDIGFEDMGESKEYYPNHGYYVNNTLVLNTRLVDDPLLFQDPTTGKNLDRFDHTLFHELGHGWDSMNGDASVGEDWVVLSGWSEEPKDGKVRVIISDKDLEEDLVGEWYYDPQSDFVRFYAKRNPWDDMADTFAFWVAGMYGFVPETKRKYFEDRIK